MKANQKRKDLQKRKGKFNGQVIQQTKYHYSKNSKLENNSEKIIQDMHQRESEGKHEDQLNREGGRMEKNQNLPN